MVQLARGGPKLLKVVNKKRHASDEDHDEPAAKRRPSPDLQKFAEQEEVNAELRAPSPRTKKKKAIDAKPASYDDGLRAPIPRTRKEKDIYAEPASTDDELRAPTPRSSRPSKSTSIATKAATSQEADELKLPTKKGSKNGLNGSVKKDARKGAKGVADHNKENPPSAMPDSSSGSGFGFGIQYLSQRSSQGSKVKKFGSKARIMNNIHAAAPSKGKRKAPRVPDAHKKKGSQDTRGDDEASMNSDSEVSMLSVDKAELDDPELRTVKVKKPPRKDIGSNKGTFKDKELLNVLKSPPEDKDLKKATRRSKPTVLHDQLGDWIKDRGPGSSQPDSIAPSEDMGNLKEYLEQLPEEEVEGTCCPLCRAPVNDDEYWDYWKGKEKTVKNQNKFCHTHRTKSAWDEYRSEGYPDIIWTDLPQRIRKHRMTLFKILNNERPSGYRDRYEPIALTGNAAAVPTKRKDLPDHVQQELNSYALDHQSVYPGYYGPHGRRVITENIMKLLKNEIKNCTDAVVQGSGPATFVQAVLVPEMAVLLIMEDCRVDQEEADDIREKTYELGMFLNEEIEDQVELHDHSDDENEYGVR